MYNRIGRGFPDISANGAWWLDFVEGEEGGWGGTSMACPIVASIINRVSNLGCARDISLTYDAFQIVEERLAIGKGPIGFLNPAIYGNTSLLHDIVSGNNLGCGTQGFKTATGWDPVTGLGMFLNVASTFNLADYLIGTPNYPVMLDYFLALP